MNKQGKKLIIESLERRRLLASGGVITSGNSYYYRDSDVPSIAAKFAPQSSPQTNSVRGKMLKGIITVADTIVKEVTTNAYKPGAAEKDRGVEFLILAIAYRHKSAYSSDSYSDVGVAPPNPAQPTVFNSASVYASALKQRIKSFYNAYSRATFRSAGNGTSQKWEMLGVGGRAESWVNMAFYLAGSSLWTETISGLNQLEVAGSNPPTQTLSVKDAVNTLLGLHGDWLYTKEASDNLPNKRVQAFTGLYAISRTSNLSGYDWDANGTASSQSNWDSWAVGKIRDEVLSLSSASPASNQYYRADGTETEQSPEYSINVMNLLMRVAYLERSSAPGTIFDADKKDKLKTIVKSNYEMVDAGGKIHATGDSSGTRVMDAFALPSMYFDGNFGGMTIEYDSPVFADGILTGWRDNGDAGGSVTLDVALTYNHIRQKSKPGPDRNNGQLNNGGFAILRKKDTGSQLLFEAGSSGGPFAAGHSQSDLLNLDLTSSVGGALSRPLIVDPGRNSDDSWMHNTITQINSSNNYMNQGFRGFYSGNHADNDAAYSPAGYFAFGTEPESTTGGTMAEGAYRQSASATTYRTVYSDGIAGKLYLVMDWVEAPANTKFEVGFNLAKGATKRFAPQTGYTSSYADGAGDVWVQPISLNTASFSSSRTESIDKPYSVNTLNRSPYFGLRIRDSIPSASGKLAFLTLVMPYSGVSPTPPTVEVDGANVNGSAKSMRVRIDGGAWFTIKSINRSWNSSLGTVATNTSQTFLGITASQVPPGTTSLTFANVTSNSMTIKWTDGDSSSSNRELRYRVERMSGSGYVTIAEVASGGSDESDHAFTDYGLNANTSYTYRITALNSQGSSAAVTASTTTLPNTGGTKTVSGTVKNTAGVGIASVKVYVDTNRNSVRDSSESYATTDSIGQYSISSVAVNSVVRAEKPSGYSTVVTPQSGAYEITSSNLGTNSHFVFQSQGVRVTGNVTTTNGDPLAGVTVFLERGTFNGLRDANEPFATTDAAGKYELKDIAPGSVRVLATKASYTISTPSGGDWFTLFTSDVGNTRANRNFVMAQLAAVSDPGVTITGTVSHNGSGVVGAVAYIDSNFNGTQDLDELAAATDSSGFYSIPNVPIGSTAVFLTPPPGYAQATPAAGDGHWFTTFSYESGGYRTGKDFTLAAITGLSVTGTVTREENGQGMAGVSVFVDSNLNGVFDLGELNATTNSTGAFTISSVPIGLTAIYALTPDDRYASMFPFGGDGYWFTSTSGEAGGSRGGLNYRFAEPFGGVSISGTVSSGGTAVSGAVIYSDVNENGEFDTDDAFVETDGDGRYLLENLPVGTTSVRLVVPTGMEQSTPADNHLLTTDLDDFGNTLDGYNFTIAPMSGVFVTGTVTLQGIGGISGAIAYIDANFNGQRDTGELYAVSNSLGAYSIANVPIGSTAVFLVPPPGHQQVTPASNGGHWFTTYSYEAGGTRSGKDFSVAIVMEEIHTGRNEKKSDKKGSLVSDLDIL